MVVVGKCEGEQKKGEQQLKFKEQNYKDITEKIFVNFSQVFQIHKYVILFLKNFSKLWFSLE